MTTRELKINDKVELIGGYDFDPLYLKNPPNNKRTGTVIKFIEGQNKSLAAVIKLDQTISGDKITGDTMILELRYKNDTWKGDSFTVQVELCDFNPDNHKFENRRQGEWIEAAAKLKIV